MKRNNTCEIKSETHSSSLYIEITHDVCKWLQNQKINNTKYINIKVYQTNSLPKLVRSKNFFPLRWSSPPKSILPLRNDIQISNFSPFLTQLLKGIESQKTWPETDKNWHKGNKENNEQEKHDNKIPWTQRE